MNRIGIMQTDSLYRARKSFNDILRSRQAHRKEIKAEKMQRQQYQKSHDKRINQTVEPVLQQFFFTTLKENQCSKKAAQRIKYRHPEDMDPIGKHIEKRRMVLRIVEENGIVKHIAVVNDRRMDYESEQNHDGPQRVKSINPVFGGFQMCVFKTDPDKDIFLSERRAKF